MNKQFLQGGIPHVHFMQIQNSVDNEKKSKSFLQPLLPPPCIIPDKGKYFSSSHLHCNWNSFSSSSKLQVSMVKSQMSQINKYLDKYWPLHKWQTVLLAQRQRCKGEIHMMENLSSTKCKRTYLQECHLGDFWKNKICWLQHWAQSEPA